jgi:hypothetical protein
MLDALLQVGSIPVLAVPVLPYYYARIRKQRRLDAARISFDLTFPRGVDQGDAQALVQSLSVERWSDTAAEVGRHKLRYFIWLCQRERLVTQQTSGAE